MSGPYSPRQDGSPRRAVNTKITASLRAQLETAAAANHRTLSAEIEARLVASFVSEPRPQDELHRTIRETVRAEMRAEFDGREAAAKAEADGRLARRAEMLSLMNYNVPTLLHGQPI